MSQAGKSWPAVSLAITVVAVAALAGLWGLNHYLDAKRDGRMAQAASPGVVPPTKQDAVAATTDADAARRDEQRRLANRPFREVANESPEYRAMSPECKGYMDVLLAFADGTGPEANLEELRRRVLEAEHNFETKCVDHGAEAREKADRKAKVDAEVKPLICKDLRERVDHYRGRIAQAEDPDWARKAAARGDQAPEPQPVVTDADRRALADAEAEIVARGC
jgi:hypothetical protein